MKSTKNLIPCKFAIEDEQIFEGFYNPDDKYWNGWLNPIVTEDVLLQVLEYYTTDHTECENYDEGFRGCTWHEYLLSYQETKKQELYNLGHMWIWSEVE